MTHERGIEIIHYRLLTDDNLEIRPASDWGTGDFDNFIRNQKSDLNQRLRKLRSNPPSRTKHGGRFRSLTEMRDAYAGRDKAIVNAERKLAFLQTGGETGEAMTLIYDDKRQLVGFEVVKLD